MSTVITEANGFLPGASYDGTQLNGTGNNIAFDYNDHNKMTNFFVNGMNFAYTGDGDGDPNIHWTLLSDMEKLTIDMVTEDLIIVIAGYDALGMEANWVAMPPLNPNVPPAPGPGPAPNPDVDDDDKELMSIKTQELAQKGIVRINDAIVRKDQIRSHLGALQNRLENTVTNINIQAENLQSAESRISDADIATEMTNFARTQILSQTAVSMLAQANSFPHMLMELIEG